MPDRKKWHLLFLDPVSHCSNPNMLHQLLVTQLILLYPPSVVGDRAMAGTGGVWERQQQTLGSHQVIQPQSLRPPVTPRGVPA